MATSNYNYELPSDGSLDWHIPLNNNFTAIEGDVQSLANDLGTTVQASYQKPSEGSIDWHIPLNQNFTDIESDVSALASDAGVTGVGGYNTPSSGTTGWGTLLNENFTDIDSDLQKIADESPEVSLSMDTMTEINNRWNTPISQRRISANTTEQVEGAGCLEVNQPEGEFYGTSMELRFPDQPEFGSGLDEAHIRCWIKLDNNYDIDDGFDGRVAGKGFPGFTGKWGSSAGSGGDASDGTNGWSARGQIYRGDFYGGTQDQFSLAYYVYSADEFQTSYHPDTLMNKGQWYQLDRYCKMNSGQNTNDGVLKQWHDGQLVINESGFDFAWESPYDKIEGIWNDFYYGGGWAAPDGSGDNHAYVDHVRVWDTEKVPQ